jgi:hypothetical protein
MLCVLKWLSSGCVDNGSVALNSGKQRKAVIPKWLLGIDPAPNRSPLRSTKNSREARARVIPASADPPRNLQ